MEKDAFSVVKFVTYFPICTCTTDLWTVVYNWGVPLINMSCDQHIGAGTASVKGDVLNVVTSERSSTPLTHPDAAPGSPPVSTSLSTWTRDNCSQSLLETQEWVVLYLIILQHLSS